MRHVDRVPHRQVQPAPLANREMLMPGVRAHLAPLPIDDVSLAHLARRPPRHQAGVVVVGHEADLLAVGLVEHVQAPVLGHLPHLVLVIRPHWQQHVIKPIARAAKEDVGLVLAGVAAAHEHRPPGGVALDARVMPGGDVVGVDGPGVGVELAELQPVVAADAGVGRAAGVVFADEVVDDAAEVALEVEHVEGHTKLPRDRAGVGGIVDGAAALAMGRRLPGRVARAVEDVVVLALGLVVGAEAHEAAEHLVAPACQQRGGDGRVNPAGHRHQDPLAACIRHSPGFYHGRASPVPGAARGGIPAPGPPLPA